MGDRRGLLKALLGLWVLPLGSLELGGLGLGGSAAATPLPLPGPGPGFHLVNGWVLTDRDLVALRISGPRLEPLA